MKIFITSWHRVEFLQRTVFRIRMDEQAHQIVIYDNGSDHDEQVEIAKMKHRGIIQDLFLAHENSGTMLPKRIFHALARAAGDEFYVVTDNDFLCPVGWLPKMMEIMMAHPEIAVLTPQYWPQWPMGPQALSEDGKVVYCNAVGNTFKLVRTAMVNGFFDELNKWGVKRELYSDDGLLCKWLNENGWKSAFCSNVFCYNLEPGTENWGYTPGQEAGDPRRAGYGAPSPKYEPINFDTLELPEELKWKV